MEWWHKIRRTWSSLSSRIKLRKPRVRVAGGRGGGADEFGGGCGGIDGGLLKLRDDVQMCGYKDVEIMWNMLSISLQPQLMEEAGRATTKAKRPRRGIKDRSRLFFWTNHSP
ncbi:uncharacterized protein LOC130710248 [Lotus japonicus]|uniref:uncharacterized protein LOC130710248 n=1 Tax=Lotus japonicus TaxID=34305 RepID=UPI002583B539|nr:uncharacterized protein LOC130710248 [Lotus japonicus]